MTANQTPLKSGLIGKTLILFVCMLILQLVYVVTVFTMVEQTRLQVVEQQEARRALSAGGRMMRSLQDLIVCMGKGEVMDAAISEVQYNDHLETLNKDLRAFKAALATKPGYEKTIAEIEMTCRTIPDVYEDLQDAKKGPKPGRVRKTKRKKHRDALMFHVEDKVMIMGKSDMEWLRVYMAASEVLARLEAIQGDYRQVEREAQEHLRFQSSLLFNAALIMGFVATVVVAFLLYHVFISGIVTRLRVINKTLDDIAGGKPWQELPSVESDVAHDEVGYLAAELQSMERSLRDIRSKEKALLENAASCICSIDEQGRFVKVSQASTVLWGVEPHELLGESLTSLIEEDDVALVEEKLDELFSTGRTVTFECRVVRPDNQSVEFSWRASLAEEQNLAVCVAHDVTVRNEILRQIKQRDVEFRGMVDCMPIAVITCDQMNAISSINPATQAMLEYSPQDLLGKKLSMLLFGGTKAGVATNEQMNEVLAAAEKRSIELFVSKADGSRLPVEFNSRHYELHDSQVHLATFKDVSARFEIETVKKEFVAMISHDLRSPLTAIHGTLEVIGFDNAKLADSLSEEDRRSAREVARAEKIVFSIVNVLNDFLDLEKFEAGLVALEFNEIALSELIEALRVELGARDEPVKFSVDADDTALRSLLNVDVTRIGFALSTIVRVADCFSEAQLELKIGRSGDQIRIVIENFKIPEHIETALHSPYVFLADSELIGVVSSGLGVSLSRAILRTHGGLVWTERRDGNCQIVVALPGR